MKVKLVKFIGGQLFAVLLCCFVGCAGQGNDNNSVPQNDDSKKIDFESYPADYALKIKNNTSSNLVAFCGKPSFGSVVGGIPVSDNVHYIKRDYTLFCQTKDFLLYIVTESDYKKYYTDHAAALDEAPFAILYAIYEDGGNNNKVYQISKKLGGECQLVINNETPFIVELRNKGIEGEVLGAIGKTDKKVFHVAEGDYEIFPVLSRMDREGAEIVSVVPVCASGVSEGEVKTYKFSMGADAKEYILNLSECLTGADFIPCEAYIKIYNNTDQNLQFFTGADSDSVIKKDTNLFYAINMDKSADKKYGNSISKAGYGVENSNGIKAYLAGDAATATEYKAGYMYTYTVTGTAETGYNIVLSKYENVSGRFVSYIRDMLDISSNE